MKKAGFGGQFSWGIKRTAIYQYYIHTYTLCSSSALETMYTKNRDFCSCFCTLHWSLAPLIIRYGLGTVQDIVLLRFPDKIMPCSWGSESCLCRPRTHDFGSSESTNLMSLMQQSSRPQKSWHIFLLTEVCCHRWTLKYIIVSETFWDPAMMLLIPSALLSPCLNSTAEDLHLRSFVYMYL